MPRQKASPQQRIAVIGGGINGCGIARDAAGRGYSVFLAEKDDLACGTSSGSTKLIHGGLRYLQQGDVRLVYEALHERRRLMKNAPHLVEILPFMIPILTKDGVVSKQVAKALGSAMWMYDLTGGWRIGRLHRRLSAERTAEHFPTCHTDKLSAGYLYYDAGADDARVTLAVARTAAAHGAASFRAGWLSRSLAVFALALSCALAVAGVLSVRRRRSSRTTSRSL